MGMGDVEGEGVGGRVESEEEGIPYHLLHHLQSFTLHDVNSTQPREDYLMVHHNLLN